MGDLSEHFSLDEFECQCGCGEDRIDRDFINHLQAIRWMMTVRFPAEPRILITSGVRCSDYNKSIGGVAESAHVARGENPGYAADVKVYDNEWAWHFMDLAFKVGIRRMGHGKKAGAHIVHVDIHPTLPQPRLWGY